MIGKYYDHFASFSPNFIAQNLLALEKYSLPAPQYVQTSLFDSMLPNKEDRIKCLTGIL